MTFNKRLSLFILSLIFIFSAFGFVFAEESEHYAPTGMHINIEEPVAIDMPKSIRKAPSRAASNSNPSLEDYIVSQMMQQKTQIYIYDYKIPLADAGETVLAIIMQHPELMAEASVGTLYYDKAPTYAAAVAVSYFTSSLEESNAARELLQSEIDRYIGYADTCPDQLGKLLIAHDRLAAECVYDSNVVENFVVPNGTTIYQDSNGNIYIKINEVKYPCFQKDGVWYYQVTNHPTSYHLYGLIYDKTAVCQGYAQMTYMLAKELGFEVNYISSKDLNHIWNCIKVDGKWYHIDTTWDDTWFGTNRAEVSHDFFLKSDADFKKQGVNGSHYATDWETYLDEIPVCDSTLYESNHIFNFPSLGITSYTDNKYRFFTSDGRLRFSPTKEWERFPLTFASDLLRSGPILVTEPTETDAYFKFSAFSTAALDNVTILSTKQKNGNLNKINIEKNATSIPAKQPISFTRTKSEYISAADEQAYFMFWDMSTMNPYSKKIIIK